MTRIKTIINHLALSLIASALILPLTAKANQKSASPSPREDSSKTFLSQWWTGRYASGDWFGAREFLENRGVRFRANWRGNFMGIVSGGLKQRGGISQEINFDLDGDGAKMLQLDSLEGLRFTGNLRWREATFSINKNSGTDRTFRPDAYTGGAGWRLRKFYATYTTPELFGIRNLLEFSGGWQVPTDLFLVQPESKLFTNESLRTAKGINPNLPWGGSFSTWGGYVKVQPLEWLYGQSGLYLAYPFGTDPLNHGLSFQGYRKDPSLNGIYSISELGVTPKIGVEKLAGRYAAGMIYWGVEKTWFDGATYDGNFQFYWQADQRLTREKPLSLGQVPHSSRKGFPLEKEEGDDQGLYFFSTLNFAPPANNIMSFYALGGLVYKGLISGRDKDQAGVAFAYGTYSFKAAGDDRSRGLDPRTYTAVLELDYRLQLNHFAFIQPLAQYIINPGGNGSAKNNFILGLHMGVNF